MRRQPCIRGGPYLCKSGVEGGPHRSNHSVAVIVEAGRSVAGEPGVEVIPHPDDVGLGGEVDAGLADQVGGIEGDQDTEARFSTAHMRRCSCDTPAHSLTTQHPKGEPMVNPHTVAVHLSLEASESIPFAAYNTAPCPCCYTNDEAPPWFVTFETTGKAPGSAAPPAARRTG